MAQMIGFLCDDSRKHCWRRRKCWLPAFSPFLTMFSNVFSIKVAKNLDCMAKGVNNISRVLKHAQVYCSGTYVLFMAV